MEMDIYMDKGHYEISLVNGSDKFVRVKEYRDGYHGFIFPCEDGGKGKLSQHL